MQLGKDISTRNWLFAGLSALPSCILIAVLVYFSVFGHRTAPTTSVIPDWAWYMALSSLPIQAAAVGFVLAYCLSILLAGRTRLATSRWVHVYVSFFVVAWNLIFSFLSFFVFVMGFGDGPVVTSKEQFSRLFIGIVTVGFPEAILISLILCSIATAIVVAVLEAIVPGPAKS